MKTRLILLAILMCISGFLLIRRTRTVSPVPEDPPIQIIYVTSTPSVAPVPVTPQPTLGR